MSLGVVLTFLWIGLVVGGLARFALPGPDPMPIWLTIAIGLVGSIVGAFVGDRSSHGSGYWTSFVSFGVAIALVGLYRRVVQRRPLFGPEARRFPTRGLGVQQYRARLQNAGIDPNSLSPDPKQIRELRLKAAIEELHRAGLLDDEEARTMSDRLNEPHPDTKAT